MTTWSILKDALIVVLLAMTLADLKQNRALNRYRGTLILTLLLILMLLGAIRLGILYL